MDHHIPTCSTSLMNIFNAGLIKRYLNSSLPLGQFYRTALFSSPIIIKGKLCLTITYKNLLDIAIIIVAERLGQHI